MSKERLEEIKRKIEEMEHADENEQYDEANEVMYDLIFNNDLQWLIGQAERVQELEKQILYLESTIESASKVTEELEGQNKEILEGLATIGNAIHEGEISGRGTDENLILEVVDKHWRVRNERRTVGRDSQTSKKK